MRGIMTEAPEAIRDTLLFKMLVNEGSLKAVEDVADRKRLENDPMQGVDAEGKSRTDAALAKAAAGKRQDGAILRRVEAVDVRADAQMPRIFQGAIRRMIYLLQFFVTITPRRAFMW